MSRLSSVFWRFAVCFGLGASLASAHQPFESTVVARLQHDRLELTLTMSNQMAGALVAAPGRGEVDDANFTQFQPQLRELAGKLFTITSGNTVLAPTLAEVQLSKIGEVEFVLIYPEPARGRVNFSASYLQQLPVTYGGTLQIFDDDAKLLAGADHLTRNDASFDWNWAPAAPNARPTTRATAPITPPPVASNDYWKNAAVPAFGIAVLLLAGWLRRRRAPAHVEPGRLVGGSAP